MTEKEFFEAIGYLSARSIKIDVEVKDGLPARSFEEQYLQLTGESAEGLADYHKIADKWGKELRVYIANINNMPEQLMRYLRSNSYNEYDGRINNNDLVMGMFTYGFRIGAEQNLRRISNSIPVSFRNEFTAGTLL